MQTGINIADYRDVLAGWEEQVIEDRSIRSSLGRWASRASRVSH